MSLKRFGFPQFHKLLKAKKSKEACTLVDFYKQQNTLCHNLFILSAIYGDIPVIMKLLEAECPINMSTLILMSRRELYIIVEIIIRNMPSLLDNPLMLQLLLDDSVCPIDVGGVKLYLKLGGKLGEYTLLDAMKTKNHDLIMVILNYTIDKMLC